MISLLYWSSAKAEKTKGDGKAGKLSRTKVSKDPLKSKGTRTALDTYGYVWTLSALSAACKRQIPQVMRGG